MLDIGSVVSMQLMLFCLMGVGAIARKAGIIDDRVRHAMSDLLLNILLPCNILASFMTDMDPAMMLQLGTVLLAAFGIELGCWLLSKLVYNWVPKNKRMVMRYGTIVNNATFVGNPVVEGVFGPGALVYSSVYVVPLRIFMWTAGLACFTTASLKETVKKVMLHPCIIATELGFLLLLSGWRPPVFVEKAIFSVAACNTAVAMMVVGNILATIELRTVLNRYAFFYSFIRLLVIPVLSMLALVWLKAPPTVTGVATILSGMPAGSSSAAMAEKYVGDGEFASKCVFLSTALSMVTIPILTTLIGAAGLV